MIGKIFFFSIGCFGVGYWLHQRSTRAEWEAARAEQEAAERAASLARALDGVWSDSRPLIADVQNDLAGPGPSAATTSSGRMVEVPLTPRAQRNVWTHATHAAREGLAKDRQATVREILSAVAPACDWSGGWEPYEADGRFRDVYEACERMLDVAECSLKYAPGASPDSPSLVCPGWVHERPAPCGDLRPGDWVEVMLDAYSVDPDDDSRNADWAWVRVDSVPPTGSSVAGTVMLEAPPGEQPNVLAHSAAHKVNPGSQIVVPRGAIFRVVQGK